MLAGCFPQINLEIMIVQHIILDVHAGWQSAQNFPLYPLQCKLDKNLAITENRIRRASGPVHAKH